MQKTCCLKTIIQRLLHLLAKTDTEKKNLGMN